MAEIVYIPTKEAIEGMIKIGRTTTSIAQRMRELDITHEKFFVKPKYEKSCIAQYPLSRGYYAQDFAEPCR
jgi:hypothetical protein